MDLETLRHSTSHIMAQAVKRLFPDVKVAIGPSIDNGFYYDFDREKPFSREDLKKIEQEMKKIVKEAIPIVRKEISLKEAMTLFKQKDEPYKMEILNEITNDKVSIYEQGDFVDLCTGPHISSTKEAKVFKLLNATGAYWRGDEKNKMLQRIYGTAFKTEKDLDEYLKKLEEAKKRDHSKLGKELDLYIINPVIGKGLPLFTPKGTIIKMILQRWIEDEEIKRGYQFTNTPVLAKTGLYKISGHLEHYRDKMFIFNTEEGEELALRPMTCPYQFMIYKSKIRSYRELPIRYSETSTLFRKELSGELHGLIRIWQFTLADAHIICMPSQLEEEFENVLKLVQYIMKTLGFTDYWYRFSRGGTNEKDKFIDNPKAWKQSEESLKRILDKEKLKYEEACGEAAFYGPKLDVQMRNVWEKEDTMFTIQIDFALPERFELTYVDKDNKEARPMVIHRASIGCYERTLAMIIEHFAGAFPTWLAPVQIKILTITNKQDDYAIALYKKLVNLGFRVETDLRGEKIGAKIRDARLEKIPFILVVGEKEKNENKVAVRRKGAEDLGTMDFLKFIEIINKEVKEKII